jgi:hypothetical protein
VANRRRLRDAATADAQWQVTVPHAAAEDAAAGRLDAGDAAGLITATLLAAFTPDQGG